MARERYSLSAAPRLKAWLEAPHQGSGENKLPQPQF
jgi:hypothetical protein